MKPINLLKGYDKLPTGPRITTIHSIYNIKHCGELNKIPVISTRKLIVMQPTSNKKILYCNSENWLII